MNKRKIALLAMSACMIAILAIGGTLAYFTDTDVQTNTFTTGNVEIDLYEDFGDNDAQGIEELLPATGSAQAGTLKNGIEKEVYVKNTGSEDAFVRVHIAIPDALDDGNPSYNAFANILHFNYDKESIGENKWDWSKTTGAAYDGDWNAYETTITEGNKEVPYNVYVVTYGKALAKDEETIAAINQVYLDSKVTNELITSIKNDIGENWKIYVAAEACQKAGFEDAYEALNTSFGVPSNTYDKIDWNDIANGTVTPKLDTWVNVD